MHRLFGGSLLLTKGFINDPVAFLPKFVANEGFNFMQKPFAFGLN